MSGFQFFLMLLTIYIGSLVGIGFYYTGRQQSVTDFWLAGRKVGPLRTGFSAAASWLTAGAILAVIGFFMLSGLGSVWGFVAPNILALLIIALFVKRLKRLPAITQPELLEQRYAASLRAPVAVIITVVMILFAVADIKSFAFLLQVYYGLSPAWAAAIVALAVSVYVTLGGFSAVVWTDVLQYLLLAAFAIAMAFMAVDAATLVPAPTGEIPSFTDLIGTMPEGWWNPLSVGLTMALIFSLAIIPGWITEQDPWQRVWAARSTASARTGMIVGAFLIAVVFTACAVIAVSLNRLYPEIAALGFPAGMARAEPALLDFVTSGRFSPFVVALTAIGLAAATMSCADTFATSGASCLSRDIYQRFIRPGQPGQRPDHYSFRHRGVFFHQQHHRCHSHRYFYRQRGLFFPAHGRNLLEAGHERGRHGRSGHRGDRADPAGHYRPCPDRPPGTALSRDLKPPAHGARGLGCHGVECNCLCAGIPPDASAGTHPLGALF